MEKGELTKEETRALLSSKYTFWTIPPMDIQIMYDYTGYVDTRVWTVLGYLEQFKDSNRMTTIIDHGEVYYWFDYDTAIPSLYVHDIRHPRMLGSLVSILCGAWKGSPEKPLPPFLKRKVIHYGVNQTATYVHFLPMYTALFHPFNDNLLPRVEVKPDDVSTEKPEEDTPITLSEDLFTFYAALKQATNAYGHHSDPREKPSKLWQSVDHYIHELMEGTFYDNHKDSLDKKYQDIASIPKQTMEDIVKVCANTVNPCGRDKKPSISSLFLRYKSGLYTSPYLDYLLSSLPPSLPDIPSKVLEKAKASYAFIEDASTASYSICQFYGKIKGLTERIDYCYYITDKIYTFYDDSTMESLKDVGSVMMPGQRKSFTKYWVAAFIDYNDFMHKIKKPSKWPTFDDWIASTKVGDSNEGSPWYNTMRYAYRMRGWCMTENKTAFAKIKSSVETAKEKKNSNGGY